MTKTAFISGATSGIGRATAQRFAKEGLRLVICGRRIERLQELQKELTEYTEVYSLNFDVRNKSAVQDAVNSLPTEFSAIDILINNAGNAHGLDPIQNGDVSDWDAMMDINVKGLLYVTRALLPSLIASKGQIINIGSTAAKEVYANGGVYCASKHAVDALTIGLRIDLNKEGVRVGAIHPGQVATEFSEVRFKGDKERASKVYKGYRPLQAEDLADIIYFACSRPYHVNIADLVVMSVDQASSTIVNKEIS